MRLSKYTKKRNLKTSLEPLAKIKEEKNLELVFVVQKHSATHLHYDLRLEVNGVLKSWAIPKEPSSDPSVKRLAIMVEDHPYEYKDFKGTIPSGYGAGTVTIWDKGSYSVFGKPARSSEKLIKEGLKKGKIEFFLNGKKLKGTFFLIRLKNSEKNWLFMKKKEKSSKNYGPKLTNLDKIFWPKEKITKGDLIEYYEKISPTILPYLKDRPESLRRFPEGIKGETFFQKNLKDYPSFVKTKKIQHADKTVNYLLIQNKETLIFAANLGCIEIHPFFSRIQKLQYPDYLIFDLDPKGASFEKVIEVAKAIYKFLSEIKVPSYCKTSGATGLHIAVPLQAKYTYEQSKKFAELVAYMVHQRAPKISTLERRVSKRKGRVYIDCYQNNFGQTLASPYCVRARPGATVSAPLDWKEVKKGLDPKNYTIKNIFSRIKKMGDIYSPVLKKGIDMKAAIKRIEKMAD